jgi:DNA mismatch repair protein PMS2
MIASNSNKTLKDTISSVYGTASIESLMPLNISFEMVHNTRVLKFLKGENGQENTETSTVKIEGYISKPIFGKGRSSGDRQLCYINSRPCVLPQITKAVNEVYKNFNTTQLPFFVLNLKLDTNKYDVNVSPDKRTILLHGENMLIELIREHLTIEFEEIGHFVPRNKTLAPIDSKTSQSGKSQSRLFSSLISNFSNTSTSSKARNAGQRSINDDHNVMDPDSEGEILDGEVSNFPGKRSADRSEETTAVPPENAESKNVRNTPAENEDEDLFVGPSDSFPEPTRRTAVRRSSTTIVDFDRLPMKQNHFDYNEPVEITLSSQKGKTCEFVQLSKSSKCSSSARPNKRYKVTKSGRSLEDFGEVLRYEGPDEENGHTSEEKLNSENEDKTIGESEDHRCSSGIESLELDQNQKINSLEEKTETSLDLEEFSSNPVKISMSQRIKSVARHRTHSLDLPVPASMDAIRSRHKRLTKLLATSESFKKSKSNGSKSLSDISISNIADDEDIVEGMLNLSIHKNDFLKMNLVGQFNLGFILVTKVNEKTGQKDLFIVDQHASDEIYNFERLQRDTVIQNQPMVV